MNYPPHLSAHAEPSPLAYHVYCPACAAWRGGAVAEEGGLGCWLVRCPACASTAPGSFYPEACLPGGVYAGRCLATMGSERERDFLDYALTAQPAPARGLRLAMLWQLGWLSAARQKVPIGPNLARLRARHAREQQQEQQQQPRPAAGPPRPSPPSSWLRLLGGETKRAQQFHRYQRPAQIEEPQAQSPEQPSCQEPPYQEPGARQPPGGTARPAWALVLGLGWPVTGPQIRAAYRRLCKRAHPDVGGTQQQMQCLNEAHAQARAWWEGQRR